MLTKKARQSCGAFVVAAGIVALMASGCGSSHKSSSSSATTAGSTGAAGSTGTTGSTGAGAGAAGNKASATGVSSNTIKVALITSLTGSDSSNSVSIPKG